MIYRLKTLDHQTKYEEVTASDRFQALRYFEKLAGLKLRFEPQGISMCTFLMEELEVGVLYHSPPPSYEVWVVLPE